MFINHNGIICHISKIDSPHKIWYHIWIDLERYGENYIREKLGVTDAILQKTLQDEFYEVAESRRKTKLLESHNLRLDKTDYAFYLTDKTEDSVTVFIEKGLFTLYPGQPNGIDRPPRGYPWAVIYENDTPEQIQAKLLDDRRKFGVALHKKLKRIMTW